MGIQNLNARTTAHINALSIFAGVDVNTLFWDASDSIEFTKKTTASKTFIEYKANFDSRGGPKLATTGLDPYSM